MTAKFLSSHFIKDYQNVGDPEVRSQYGKLSGILCLICNVLLFAAKLTVGILSGAVSVIADAINNLSDASSNIVSFIGFKLAERPADKEHPYGHGRYEYLAGLIVSVFILTIGLELLKSGIEKLVTPSSVDFSVALCVVLGVSVLVKLWMMLINLRFSRMIDSETLKATAMDSRNDVITTTAVLVGMLLEHFLSVNLDAYMAILVSLFILFSGFKLTKEMLDPLLGKAPDSQWVEEIRQKILSYPNVIGTHDLLVHDYGPGRQFASVHVEMPESVGLREGHAVCDQIEEDLFAQTGLHLVVHLDPVSTTDDLLKQIEACVKQVDASVTMHDYKHLCHDGREEVQFDCIIPEALNLPPERATDYILERIHAVYPDLIVHVKIDTDYAPVNQD